jgi:hypothetical protein
MYVSREREKKIEAQTVRIPTSGLRCLEEFEPIIYTNTHQKCWRVFLTLAVIELLLAETKLSPINNKPNGLVHICHITE